jgi:hypothetical protein
VQYAHKGDVLCSIQCHVKKRSTVRFQIHILEKREIYQIAVSLQVIAFFSVFFSLYIWLQLFYSIVLLCREMAAASHGAAEAAAGLGMEMSGRDGSQRKLPHLRPFTSRPSRVDQALLPP